MLGFLIIIIFLSGIILPVPAFGWKNTTELTTKVLAGENLALIGLQFVFVGSIAILGILLTGKRITSFLLGFPVLYILTIVALVIAGSSVIKSVNIEAVIFSLAIGLLIGNLFNLPAWLREALSTELFIKIGLCF